MLYVVALHKDLPIPCLIMVQSILYKCFWVFSTARFQPLPFQKGECIQSVCFSVTDSPFFQHLFSNVFIPMDKTLQKRWY
jgi:hypothetical protein